MAMFLEQIQPVWLVGFIGISSHSPLVYPRYRSAALGSPQGAGRTFPGRRVCVLQREPRFASFKQRDGLIMLPKDVGELARNLYFTINRQPLVQ